MKKMNKKGFTLAELLIVVAIIAVLVAIAIPVFNAQLEKSRDAVDQSNIRAAYGQAVADYLDDGSITTSNFTLAGQSFNATTNASGSVTVTLQSGNKSTKGVSYTGMTDGIFTSTGSDS